MDYPLLDVAFCKMEKLIGNDLQTGLENQK
jgi:hypothetical protein